MSRFFANLFLCAVVLPVVFDTAASGQTTVLDFEGLQDREVVGEFYNGGVGGDGSGPGPDLGVLFSLNGLALIDEDAGGTGDFGGEPSPSTILFFTEGNETFMNVEAGFDTGFSFFYSAVNNEGSVSVFDGLNGTGTLLASIDLPLTPRSGAPDPTGLFSPFIARGVGFSGTARSVSFAGVNDQIGFDNITFGSVEPEPPTVPEPTSPLLLAGLVAGAFARRIRR